MEANIEQLKKLREPFPPHQVSKLCRSTKRDNPKGSCRVCGGYHGLPAIALDYVGHAALTDRLLEVDPSWTWEPLATGPDGLPVLDRDGGMWIKLTVCGVTRLGYGDAQGKTGGDAMKERIGDALRNAAMRFGAALDLWHKGDLHIEDEPQEKTVTQADPQRTAKPKALTDDELDAACIAIGECDDMESLKGIFTGAFKRANADQQTVLTSAKDKRKSELDQPKKAA